VGRKCYDFFRKRNYNIGQQHLNIFSHLEYHHAQTITDYAVNNYMQKKSDLIEVIYNEFKNIVQQNVIVEKYLPLTAEKFEGELNQVDYLYEPDKFSLLSALLPKHLGIQTWRILLESNAAEQGARMTAMENATDNASDMIDDLTLHYNKARQASITKELAEIVGGSEALSNM
jgi:F-type H+-transporting ATPase subunit gamma